MDYDSPKGKQKQCPIYCSKNRHIYEQPMDGYAVYNVFQHIQLNYVLVLQAFGYLVYIIVHFLKNITKQIKYTTYSTYTFKEKQTILKVMLTSTKLSILKYKIVCCSFTAE